MAVAVCWAATGGIGDAEQQFEHLMATVLQQSHLCPLPLNQQPVYWQYDHAMHLFPLPHLLVLADGGGQAHTSFSGCKCVTPVCTHATHPVPVRSHLVPLPMTAAVGWRWTLSRSDSLGIPL